MNVTYGYRWFRAKKRLTEVWDAGRAEGSHAARESYVVVLAEEVAPVGFVEVNGGYVGVGRLDPLQREYLSYTFDEVEPGRLFLTAATHREFQGESDRVARGTTYNFEVDGRVVIEDKDFVAGTQSTRETRADVAGNWEPYPDFGRYESIARAERD